MVGRHGMVYIPHHMTIHSPGKADMEGSMQITNSLPNTTPAEY